MSFEVECLNCGALSAASVGTCPYCKTIVAPNKKCEKETPQVTAFKKLYTDSKMAEALYMGKKLWDSSEKAKKSPVFLSTFAKVLFETESYPSLLNAVLMQTEFLKNPIPEMQELSEIVKSRPLLEKGRNDLGEIKLNSILKNNPKSAYAHFILGTHLYFVDNEIRSSIIHLENCVKFHPRFLRAWGCLGAIYKKLGKDQLAARAFKEAAKLENNSRMKKFFKSQI